MRNRHKFTFIICCAVIDMIAMVLGTMLFLKIATDENVGLNVLFLDKLIPITILSWLFSITYFKLYRVDVLFSLEEFFGNSWRAFFTQRILWYIYIYVFQDNILYFFGSRANLIQLSFLLFYFLPVGFLPVGFPLFLCEFFYHFFSFSLDFSFLFFDLVDLPDGLRSLFRPA